MTSSSDLVKCTVRDGVISLHLDDVLVSIPSDLANESRLLTGMLSSVADASVTRDFTLAAPKA
jgi:hypothetical protein